MACLDELNQAKDKTWIGISRTGEMRKFETLGDFKKYQDALGCRDIRPAPYVESIAAKDRTPTGFVELKPRDPDTQARFDATSDQWEGVYASDAAVKQGLFIEDSAEPARIREKKPQPMMAASPPPPAKTNDLCVVQ